MTMDARGGKYQDLDLGRGLSSALAQVDPAVAQRAALAVCSRARSVEDARFLLQALGLVNDPDVDPVPTDAIGRRRRRWSVRD